MIKVIILVFIVILCAMIGYLYGEGFKRRYVELGELMRSLIDMENEILYSYRTLPEVIECIADKSQGTIKDLFLDIATMLHMGDVENVNLAFSMAMDNQKNNMSIRKEDFDIILDLSKSLGDTDIIGQEQIFALAKSKMDRRIIEADKDYRTNCKMYKTLGICIGLMVAIFLV